MPVFLAAKISELSESDWREQLARFFQFSDPAVVYGLSGAVLLGLVCGLLGAFIVLRGMALMGDTLGHAVLPGVALSFMITGRKEIIPLMIGASLAGALGTGSVWAIRHLSRIKEDAAMGLVLSSFFALGIVFLTIIQKSSVGAQSGLDKFLFGQAATLGRSDVLVLAIVALVCLTVVLLLLKELTVASFDPLFARATGLPVPLLNALLMGLVTVAVVASIPAVGVVLVSAMLITPAATAQLLSKRMPTMLVLSTGIGALSGALGALLSFLGHSIPTGPCMVLAATFFFVTAYLFAPGRGLVMVAWRRLSRRRRTERENLVKSIYRSLEDRNDPEWLELADLAADRNESVSEVQSRIRSLGPLVQLEKSRVKLCPEGIELGKRLVRNHRLWELFLTRQADIAHDHVHRDAEEIEHVLPPEVVARLEDLLDNPETDPHGRPIPR